MNMRECKVNENHYESLVNVTNDREACEKRWIAVLVQMNTEKKVCIQLDKLQIENYLPIQQELHQWSDRKKKVDRIVIPMVVFVRLDEKHERKLRTYSFIHKVISYPGQRKAAIIPDEQIERLKFMLNCSDTKVEINNNDLIVGERVQIVRGPLKNLEGELCYLKIDKPMVAIRIECLGFACVNVSKNDITII